MNTERLYIALYKGKSWLSWAIKRFSWSCYSHASLVLMDGDVVVSIIEAWNKGVVETHSFRENHTPGTKIDLYEFRKPLTEADRKCIMAAAKDQLGKPYDWCGVFSFLFRRRMQKEGSWFCSELASHCCGCAGRVILNEPDWKIMPGGIAISPELRMAWRVEA